LPPPVGHRRCRCTSPWWLPNLKKGLTW